MKKKTLTRKKIALRWLLAAAALGALAWALVPWALNPEAAHRQTVKRQLAGEMEIVYKMESPRGQTLLISLNDRVVAMGAYSKLHWYQWDCQRLNIAERETGRPFAAGYIAEFYSRAPEEKIYDYYIFGVVQDEAVTELQIEFDAIEGGYDQSIRLTEEDWITTESGERVFLWALEPEEGNWSRACAATGYLADGTATQTLQIMGNLRWE